MATRICAPAQSRHLSVSQAMQACYTACDLSDVHLAHSCLQTLLARARACDEDDADTCDGLAALVNLINESLRRREEGAMAALQTMFDVVERERGVMIAKAACPHPGLPPEGEGPRPSIDH